MNIVDCSDSDSVDESIDLRSLPHSPHRVEVIENAIELLNTQHNEVLSQTPVQNIGRIEIETSTDVNIGPVYNGSVTFVNVVKEQTSTRNSSNVNDNRPPNRFLVYLKSEKKWFWFKLIFILTLTILSFSATIAIIDYITVSKTTSKFITRDQWKAVSLTNSDADIYFNSTPGYVELFYIQGDNCITLESCSSFIRKVQLNHMKESDYPDIGYNFLIDFDGIVYEGRGWKKIAFVRMDDNIKFSIAAFSTKVTQKQWIAIIELLDTGEATHHLTCRPKIFILSEVMGKSALTEIEVAKMFSDKGYQQI